MSAPEVAKHLGVSERRVRAMVADGQLSAQRLMGRWAISAKAVSGYHAKDAGRPMSERSAWEVMQYLADQETAMPARLRHRVHRLAAAPAPEQRLRSWLAARGRPVRAWAFKPALDRLQDDERVVVSGDRTVEALERSGCLRIYVDVSDAEVVMSDHGVEKVVGDRLPNVLMWVVSSLAAVPRQPDDEHAAAEVVAALDLLDDGDARAAGVAYGILGRAVGGIE